MSHVVISSFENVAAGDLQAEGEAITVFPSESLARTHFDARVRQLASAFEHARASDPQASFIRWTLMLHMPLDVESVEEALEDLELVLEETESIDDPFSQLVVAYDGHRNDGDHHADYPLADALRGLQAWLS